MIKMIKRKKKDMMIPQFYYHRIASSCVSLTDKKWLHVLSSSSAIEYQRMTSQIIVIYNNAQTEQHRAIALVKNQKYLYHHSGHITFNLPLLQKLQYQLRLEVGFSWHLDTAITNNKLINPL